MSKYRQNKVYKNALSQSNLENEISILTIPSQKKDMTVGHVFLLGFRPPKAASTL